MAMYRNHRSYADVPPIPETWFALPSAHEKATALASLTVRIETLRSVPERDELTDQRIQRLVEERDRLQKAPTRDGIKTFEHMVGFVTRIHPSVWAQGPDADAIIALLGPDGDTPERRDLLQGWLKEAQQDSYQPLRDPPVLLELTLGCDENADVFEKYGVRVHRVAPPDRYTTDTSPAGPMAVWDA
jgi:hypothetical protein